MHHLPSKPLLIIFAVNIAAAVLWFSSSHQSQAAGNTYYVSKQGSDSNSCISAGSGTCLTITGGASKMSGGDTLLIQAGTYNENMEWQTFPWRTGNASTYTRYARYQNDVVTIVGQGSGAGSGSKTISFYNNSNYIEIDGLAFDGVNTDGVVRVETPAHHIRIKNSVLKNAPVGCWPNTPSIIGAQGGTNIEFLNNDIYGAAVGYGIYMATSDSVMDGNRIHDNGQYGIHMYSDHGGVNNNTIRNNTIYNNGYTPAQNCDGGTQSHGVGLLVGSGTGHLVYNNLIYDNYYALSAQYGGCGDIQIYNNTIYNNQGASDATSIHVSGCPNTTIRNNIVYQNIGGISCVDGAQCTSSNNLTSDPNFISSSDFHLQSSSPAKDAGVSLPEVPCDFDGNGRPAGSAYDIGAYEQGGTLGSGCTKGSGGITPTPVPNQPPVVSISTTPQSIYTPGQGVVLQWYVTNATSCTASGSWPGSQATGGSLYLHPQTTSIYTLTCTGPGGTGQGSATVTVGASTACTQYTSSSQVPQGFGVPWDVTSPSTVLLSAACTPPTVLVKVGNPNTTSVLYVYKTAYTAPRGAQGWTPVNLFGSSLISGAWYKSFAQGVAQMDTATPNYFVAYTCQWIPPTSGQAGKWMCGCRDSACSQSYWQIQKIQQ